MRRLGRLSAFIWVLASCAPDPGAQAYLERGLEAYRKERFSQAAKDFQKLANEGHVLSQLYLARMHANGEGFPIDYNQAAYWYFKAAEGGAVEAQNELGYLYLYGTGVTKDLVESAYWFRRAANQGSTEAQLNLAEVLTAEGSTRKQKIEAYSWYTIASRQVGAESKQDILLERNKLLEFMFPEEIAEAERLAYQWIPSIERR